MTSKQFSYKGITEDDNGYVRYDCSEWLGLPDNTMGQVGAFVIYRPLAEEYDAEARQYLTEEMKAAYREYLEAYKAHLAELYSEEAIKEAAEAIAEATRKETPEYKKAEEHRKLVEKCWTAADAENITAELTEDEVFADDYKAD